MDKPTDRQLFMEDHLPLLAKLTVMFLEKLQEIEDLFTKYQKDNKQLSEDKAALELEVADLKQQMEILTRRVNELEDTAEQSVKGIHRVWSRVFGN